MQKQRQEKNTHALRVCTALFHVGWIIIIACAAWRRFSLPLEPLVDRDVWGYLSPALVKISGGAFIQSEGRAFLYPGLVYWVLTTFHSLGAITVIQHLVGLATGLLLLLNWKLARKLLPAPLIPAVVHDFAGLGLLAIFLLSTQSVIAEHHLRPEGISPFFVMLAFGFTIRFLLAKYIRQQLGPALWHGAASLGIWLLLPLLKPSYSLTSVFATLPVWWHLSDRRETWLRRATMAGGPILAAWLLLWIPEGRYASADPRTQTFLPASLFTIHAVQIRTQMASDVASDPAGLPYSHAQLQIILQLLDAELELSHANIRRSFTSLGFDADYLLYEDSFCRKLADILPERQAQADFYRFYFRRTWSQNPGAMLHKFTAQLGLFYNLKCPVYQQLSGSFGRSYTDAYHFLSGRGLNTVMARVPATANYVTTLPRLIEAHVASNQPRILKALMPLLALSYLPDLCLGLAAIAWLLVDRDLHTTCGCFAAAMAIGYACNLGNNIAIALFHTLGVGRYSHVQLASTLLNQALSLWLVFEIAKRKFTTRTPNDPVRKSIRTLDLGAPIQRVNPI